MTGWIPGIGQPFSPDWQLQNWNEALFRHFFSSHAGAVDPVTRLYVTAEELKKAVGEHTLSAENVRSEFIATLRKTIGTNSLGLDADVRAYRWNRDSHDIPPFLSHLLFTCMIANDLSYELKGIGDFRRRLTKTLGRGTNHGLERERMTFLWHRLSAWLLKQTGPPLHSRPLQLPYVPTSGRFCIIGHPLRLAFPSRSDQIVLTAILSERGTLTSKLSVPDVLAIVGRNASRFSPEFQEVFVEFRRAYRQASVSALYNTAFWSTILDIVSNYRSEEDDDRSSAGIRLEVEEEDGRFLLNLTANRDLTHGLFESIPIPAARLSPYTRLITLKATHSETAISSLVLDPAKHRLLDGVCPRSVRSSAKEGFLMFEQSEDGPFEYTSRLPAAGDLIALVEQKLSEYFRKSLKASHKPAQFSSSNHPGWIEVRGLRAEELLTLDLSSQPILAAISSLQKIIPLPRIRVIGGVKTESGYLLAKSFMPSVEIADATAVVATNQSGTEVLLSRSNATSPLWSFPFEALERLEGSLRLLAKRNEQYLAAKEIRFSETVVGTDYKTPSDPARWFVEGGSGDLTPLAAPTSVTASRRPRRFAITETSPAVGERTTGKPQVAELSEFLDALASILVRRKGIPEYELFDLVSKVLALSGRDIWPLLQSWVDQGLLDCVSNADWKSRVYLARRPSLNTFSQSGRSIVALTGLTPKPLVQRFTETTKRLMMASLPRTSPNPLVPVVLAVEATSTVQIENLADELQLDPPIRLTQPQFLVKALDPATQSTEREPATWDVHRTWDWSSQRFVESPSEPERLGFGLVWCRRDDAPDVYKTRHLGATKYWSRSRNWSLLHLFKLAEVSAFRYEGLAIVPECYGLYLPLPLARFAAIVGPQAPGADLATGRTPGIYRYTLPDESSRNEVLESLYPKPSVYLSNDLRRIARALSSRGGRLVPVPQLIRKQLAAVRARGLSEVSLDFVPIRALPELFHLVKKIQSLKP